MALTPQEEAELALLEQEELTAAEQAELAALEAEAAGTSVTTGPTPAERMHPDVSLLDRFAVKNLGTYGESTPSAIAYLKRSLPNHDITLTQDGRIQIVGGQDKTPMYLDPSGLELADLTDIVADIGAGTVEGAGNFLGGVGGAIGGFVAGGVPGGALGALAGRSAGGAGAAYLTDLARQKAGEIAGVNDQVDSDAAAETAKWAAAVPLGGALARGTYRGVRNSVVPGVGSMITGVPSEQIRTAMNRMPEIDQLDIVGREQATQTMYDKIARPLQEGAEKRGRELAQRIEEAGGRVNIRSLKERINRTLEEYRTKQGLEGADTEQLRDSIKALEEAQKAFKRPTPLDVTSQVYNMSPAERAQFEKIYGPIKRVELEAPVAYGSTPYGKKLRYHKFVVEEVPDEMTPTSAWDLQKQIYEINNAKTLTPQGTLVSRRMANAANEGGKRVVNFLDEAADEIGSQLENLTARTEQVMTPVADTRTIIDRLKGMAAPEPKLTPVTTSSQSIKDEFKEIRDIQRLLNKHMADPQSTYSTLTNLDKKSKMIASDVLDRSKKFGVDVKDDADLLRAHEMFGSWRGELPWRAVSSRGMSGMAGSGLAMGMGYQGADALYSGLTDSEPIDEEGLLAGGRSLARAGGMLAGAALGSPAMLKMGLRAGRGVENATKAAATLGGKLPVSTQGPAFTLPTMFRRQDVGKSMNVPFRFYQDVAPYTGWHLLSPNQPPYDPALEEQRGW